MGLQTISVMSTPTKSQPHPNSTHPEWARRATGRHVSDCMQASAPHNVSQAMCNPNCTSPGTKIGQGGLGALGIGPGNLELAEELFLTE